MTNKEWIIAVLTDDPITDGSDYLSEIYYAVACPYHYGDKNAKCFRKEPTRDMCEECKCEWLDKEKTE